MGQPMDIVMNNINARQALGWWYNPRNGNAKNIGTFSAKGIKTFNPPSSGHNNDWVLVLDSKHVSFAPPGKVDR